MDILSNADTRRLIERLYVKEGHAILSTKYRSTSAQLRDDQSRKSAYNKATSLLDMELEETSEANDLREKARETIWQYARGALRNSVENIRNMNLRCQYVQKIRENAIHWKIELGDAGTDIDEIRAIADKAAAARNFTLEATRAKISKTGVAFSRWLKETGIDFQRLLDYYTEKHFPNRSFISLESENKIRVYASIVEASGRSNAIVNFSSKAFGALGVVSMIVILGAITWDVVESSNPILTAVEDSLEAGAGIVGGIVGTELGALFGTCGGPLGIFIGGVIGGLIGGFGAGLAAHDLLGATEAAFRYQTPQALTDHSFWGNPIRYEPRLPDGSAISHEFTS